MDHVSDNEFVMWRAVFAFALVDHVLSIEEQDILSHHLRDQPFSKLQLNILRLDMDAPQDVEALYNQIQSDDLKKKFCQYARTLVWCDGDIDLQEKEILKRVSCLGGLDNKHHLSESGASEWAENFAKKYEAVSFMNARVDSPLFQIYA